MLDPVMRRLINRPLDMLGRRIALRGVTPSQVSLAGLALGIAAASAIALGSPGWAALVPLLAGRVADGLDGAVARAGTATDFGGYLDIFCDFCFYALIPLAFVLRDPQNGLAATALLASFYINAASFLGFAVLAEKHRMQTEAQGKKALYYSAGLMEGTETILFFVAMCLWPESFHTLALIFAALCLVTALARTALAARHFAR